MDKLYVQMLAAIAIAIIMFFFGLSVNKMTADINSLQIISRASEARIAVLESQYSDIKRQLDRIEQKLNTK